MKKKLTEKQAWLLLARAFEGKTTVPMVSSIHLGMCSAIADFGLADAIDVMVYQSMARRIRMLITPCNPSYPYLFQTTPAGNIKRVQLAHRFAKECAVKPKTKSQAA